MPERESPEFESIYSQLHPDFQNVVIDFNNFLESLEIKSINDLPNFAFSINEFLDEQLSKHMLNGVLCRIHTKKNKYIVKDTDTGQDSFENSPVTGYLYGFEPSLDYDDVRSKNTDTLYELIVDSEKIGFGLVATFQPVILNNSIVNADKIVNLPIEDIENIEISTIPVHPIAVELFRAKAMLLNSFYSDCIETETLVDVNKPLEQGFNLQNHTILFTLDDNPFSENYPEEDDFEDTANHIDGEDSYEDIFSLAFIQARIRDVKILCFDQELEMLLEIEDFNGNIAEINAEDVIYSEVIAAEEPLFSREINKYELLISEIGKTTKLGTDSEIVISIAQFLSQNSLLNFSKIRSLITENCDAILYFNVKDFTEIYRYTNTNLILTTGSVICGYVVDLIPTEDDLLVRLLIERHYIEDEEKCWDLMILPASALNLGKVINYNTN